MHFSRTPSFGNFERAVYATESYEIVLLAYRDLDSSATILGITVTSAELVLYMLNAARNL